MNINNITVTFIYFFNLYIIAFQTKNNLISKEIIQQTILTLKKSITILFLKSKKSFSIGHSKNKGLFSCC